MSDNEPRLSSTDLHDGNSGKKLIMDEENISMSAFDKAVGKPTPFDIAKSYEESVHSEWPVTHDLEYFGFPNIKVEEVGPFEICQTKNC